MNTCIAVSSNATLCRVVSCRVSSFRFRGFLSALEGGGVVHANEWGLSCVVLLWWSCIKERKGKEREDPTTLEWKVGT